MSEFVLINGYPVPVDARTTAELDLQEVGGEVVPAFHGNLLSSVKGLRRAWRITTLPLEEQMGRGLISTLELPWTLDCDGALLGGPARCRARNIRSRAVPVRGGFMRVVEFELHEEAPAKSPWAIVFGYQGGNLISRPAMHFSRSSPAMYRDRSGVWREAAPGVPRTTWGTDPVTGLLVPRYRTEPGATNYASSTSVTGGESGLWEWTMPAPGRYRLTALVDAPAHASNYPGIIGPYAAAADEAVTLSAWIGTGSSPHLQIRASGFSATQPVVRDDGRQVITMTHTAPWVHSLAVYAPADVRADIRAGDYIELVLPQIEATPYATSPILTDGAPEDRGRDTLYMDLPEEIQRPGAPMAVYSRCVVGASGSDMGNQPGVWAINSVSGSGPRLALYLHSITSRPVLVHQNDVTISQSVAVRPAAGDLLETLSIVWSDDQGRLVGRLIASVNRGPLAAADLPPLAPAAAWSAPRLYVGSRGTAPGVYEWESLKVYAGRLSGSDTETMDFMRAFGGV